MRQLRRLRASSLTPELLAAIAWAAIVVGVVFLFALCLPGACALMPLEAQPVAVPTLEHTKLRAPSGYYVYRWIDPETRVLCYFDDGLFCFAPGEVELPRETER